MNSSSIIPALHRDGVIEKKFSKVALLLFNYNKWILSIKELEFISHAVQTPDIRLETFTTVSKS